VLAAALTALATAIVLLPAAAQANSNTFKDAAHDTANSNNVLRYRVHNGKRISVTTHHRNLTKKAVDIQFEIDTPAKGANFHVYASANGRQALLYRGQNYGIKCAGIKVTRKLGKDTLKLSVPRTCVGRPKGKIRVRARVQWNNSGSKGDWAPNKGFSPWVRR